MKLPRPRVRIKRPDLWETLTYSHPVLCRAPRSTCPPAEECRTAGLGRRRRRATQRHHVQRLSILVECPEVRNSNRSTAARPISSDWYVTLGLDRLPLPVSACLQVFSPRPHGIGLHAPPRPAARSPSSTWDRPQCASSTGRSAVPMGSPSARLLDRPLRVLLLHLRPLRRPRGIGRLLRVLLLHLYGIDRLPLLRYLSEGLGYYQFDATQNVRTYKTQPCGTI